MGNLSWKYYTALSLTFVTMKWANYDKLVLINFTLAFQATTMNEQMNDVSFTQ